MARACVRACVRAQHLALTAEERGTDAPWVASLRRAWPNDDAGRAPHAQVNALWRKINELDIERQEHGLVLGALQPMDDGRKCFRLIGDVLVERTVGEVSSERHSTAEQAGGGHGRAPTAPTALFWRGSAFPLCAARLLAQRG